MGIEVKNSAVVIPNATTSQTNQPAKTDATNAANVATQAPVEDKVIKGQNPPGQVEVEFKPTDEQKKEQELKKNEALSKDFNAVMASAHAGGGVYSPKAKAKAVAVQQTAARNNAASIKEDKANAAKEFNKATDVAQTNMLSQVVREENAGKYVDQARRTVGGVRNSHIRNAVGITAGAKQIYDGIKDGDIGDITKGGIKLVSGLAGEASAVVNKNASKLADAASKGFASEAAALQAAGTKAMVDTGLAAWKMGSGAVAAIKYGADAIKTFTDPNLSLTEKVGIGGAQAATAGFGATSVISSGIKLLKSGAAKAMEAGVSAGAKLVSVAEGSAKAAEKFVEAGASTGAKMLGVAEGGVKFAEKWLGKAFPIASTALAGKEAWDVFHDPKSKTVDRIAATVHIGTSAAALIPGVGTAIAIGGELAYGAYKFARQAGYLSDATAEKASKWIDDTSKTLIDNSINDGLVGVI